MSGAKFGDVFSTTAKVLISLFLIFLGVSIVYSLITATTPKDYLYPAYAFTWTVHIVYLGILVRRYSRLRKEIEELGKK